VPSRGADQSIADCTIGTAVFRQRVRRLVRILRLRQSSRTSLRVLGDALRRRRL